MTPRWANRLRRALHGGLPVWVDPAYRLPLAGLEGQRGLEPRRADFAVSWLLERGALRPQDLRRPERVSTADLRRVHTDAWLERLATPDGLAAVFAAAPREIAVDELLHTVRLACGGTLAAAREAIARQGPALNLLGGFHHASPDRGAGLCPVNDIAIAVAALRAEGFRGTVGVLDLDAHPPDGTADCLAADPATWLGSLSGVRWGALPGVDETVLPQGAPDAVVLAALEALLGRMPRLDLAFVLAGGDVLAGDRLGQLGMSLAGVRRRDLAIAEALDGVPSVWLPGGGYHEHAWRVLAGTGLALAVGSEEEVPAGIDPLGLQFGRIYRALRAEDLEGSSWLSEADLVEALGLGSAPPLRLLGYYTAEGLEFALARYGVLGHLSRLGYRDFRVELARTGVGDRMQLYADPSGERLLLVEQVLSRERLGALRPEGLSEAIAQQEVLYIHWLTLRHPRARFEHNRPRLPGQEEPGLGLAREAGELTALMATRLGLAGVALRPAWYHVAYVSRYAFRFLDPEYQGRFEALQRDLAAVPLLALTLAIADGRVTRNGAPYTWEAEPMVRWLGQGPDDVDAVALARGRSRFALLPAEDDASKKRVRPVTTG